MASKAAHNSTGWAAGVIAAALVEQSPIAQESRQVWAALAFLMAFSGGTAPDWMEISWWSRGSGRHSWITHRTWTHWGVAWLASLWLSYTLMPRCPGLALLFGFSAGGVTHLLADYPNPLGVPWIFPTRRHSLKLWNSGRGDLLVVGTAWFVAVYVADRAWFEGQLWTLATGQVHQRFVPWLSSHVRTYLGAVG